ncbi:MAG: family 78 glycoside hydrolase catalytic domain [Solobacterium sp.]|nr:family 78 glycoside hydrolase catalytic domain [Solobacterium sp.]
MKWIGEWITGKGGTDVDEQLAPHVFQKHILLQKPVAKAEILASALGCYTVRIDGRLISDCYFAPGYTQYNKRILYNRYDVTEFFTCKDSVIQAEVSGGWYAGRLGLTLKGNRYGRKRAFLMELHVTYTDGTETALGTDETWMVTNDGPRRFASFFDGEVYDARMSLDEARWQQASVYDGPLPQSTEEADGVFVMRHEKLNPVRIWKGKDGDTLVDFGRNIAGIVEIGPFHGHSGRRVTIRHGEIVQNERLFTENLRSAKATLSYICKDGIQEYLPRFTYMGFRYISVTGMDVTDENICAWELYSDMQCIGTFECSDENLNQLQRNIMTSLKANFVDIPTDCPQRDERSGWTGDIAVFAPTAAFNMDISRFMKKWLRDLSLCQRKNGAVAMFVPDNGFGWHKGDGLFGLLANSQDALWGDAAILVPWAVYLSYGDRTILESQYESMKKWIAYEEKMASKHSIGLHRYIWTAGFHFGDWLAPGESMLENMKKAKWTSTAYFANSANLMSRIASILGYEEDAQRYRGLYENICRAFQKILVDQNGHIRNGFQSAYVLALQFGLLNSQQEKTALEDLIADIRVKDDHLSTGFVGTDRLLYALSDHGALKTAYDVLLQKTYPSWLYPVLCGATSMWERWDSLKPDGTVNTDGSGEGNMVSFNHYAYGAVGSWLYTRIGGLEMIEPGYRKFRVAPMPGGGLTYAKVSHVSPFGKIGVNWTVENRLFTLDVNVPLGTEAEIIMPDGTFYQYGKGEYHLSCSINQEDLTR